LFFSSVYLEILKELRSESLYMFLVPLTTIYQILKNITKYGHVMIDLEIQSIK